MIYNRRILTIVIVAAVVIGLLALAAFAIQSQTPASKDAHSQCCATMDGKMHKMAAPTSKSGTGCDMHAQKGCSSCSMMSDKTHKSVAGQCGMKSQHGKAMGSNACAMKDSKACSMKGSQGCSMKSSKAGLVKDSKSCTMCGTAKSKAAAVVTRKAANAKTVTLKLTGLMCDPCATSVSQALSAVPGVSEARVTVDPMQAVVTYDPAKTGVDALKKAVRGASPMHGGQKFDVVK